MNLNINQISYACESGSHYYPFWWLDYELDGKRQLRKMQAQNVIDAKQALCRELNIQFTWP